MKKTAIAIGIILGIIVCLFLFKNIIAKNIISAGIKAVTGLTLEVGSVELGVFKPVVAVKDLRLLNPYGYPDKLMVDLPEFYADYGLAAFLKGKVYLRQLRVNLRSLEVSKNAQGRLNLESLKALQPKGSGPAPKIRIDKLVLDIGKVSYKDYSAKAKPAVSEYTLNIHETYENIDDPQSLIKIILARALKNSAIRDLNPLKKELNSFSDRATKILEESAGSVQRATQDIKKSFEGLVPANK